MQYFNTVVSASVLGENLVNPEWRIVDCRFDLMDESAGLAQYNRAHISGAVYADLNNDLAGPVTERSGRHPLPAPGVFAATLSSWGIDKSTQVVVYDDGSGAIAARLWWMLRWLGHTGVAVLDGGFAAWVAAGNQTDSSAPVRVSRDFVPRVDAKMEVSTEQLVGELTQSDPPLVVDARAERRFRGEIEPIDTRAGHIPGARNFPFSNNLGQDGRWKSPEELAGMFDDLGINRSDGTWVAMCGSGVTACHLVLAAVRAGIPEPRLYIGSWSEWLRDPERPIEGSAHGQA